MVTYELWEGRSGNLMASFSTEDEARAVLADRAQQYGPESVASIDVVRVEDDDEAGD